jgi:predicted nucleic acid-binding Zn ribbon protein
MPSKRTNHSKHGAKKSAKKAQTPVATYQRTTLRRVHTTPAGSAADIRATLGITKDDLKAALTAIDSAL